MTNATFITNHEGKYIGFIIEGHSGFSELGYDIVCAGISTISQGAIIGVQEIAGAEAISSIDMTNVKLSIIVTDRRPEMINIAEILIGTTKAVIGIIHEQYPDYVNIKTEEANVI